MTLTVAYHVPFFSQNKIFILYTKIRYTANDWMICGDLKVLCMLLGQQAAYTKYPCFTCEWGRRARSQSWEQRHWTPRTSLEPWNKNIMRKSIVDPKKILLPPIHMKLGIMKQFVKALPKTGNCFKCLYKTFPHLSKAKLKEGVFVGPDINN
jgi:hypothetical protein